MFPHDFVYCRWRGDTTSIGSRRKPSIMWTRVHAIHWLQHVLKKRVSGLRSMAYLATRGRCWSAGSSSNGGHRDHNHHRDLLPSDGGCSSKSWTTRSRDRDHPFTWSAIGRLRRHVEELHDRGPIEPRSSRDRGAYAMESSPSIKTMTYSDLGSWLTHDRGPIVTRSCWKTWSFWGYCEAKSKRISSRSWSHDAAPTNRSHDFAKPPPRPLQLATISGQFPSLKSCISFLCSSTFDRLVKKLSEFRGRS